MEPLPPVKEVEYRCYISKIFEELSGSEYMTFAFETAKEFSSFRYEIAVRYRIQPGLLEFKVLGMTATRTMMPSFGTARSVLKIPVLPVGVYEVKMIKSDGAENMFSIEVTKRGFQLLQPIPRKRFIDIVIENKAAAPGARNISTVSKTPPAPLVPRTIQKRQQLPATAEELEMAESLHHETQEEHEASEFLGRSGNGNASSRKSSAKRVIDEIEEAPVKANGVKEIVEKSKAKPGKVAKAAKSVNPALKPKDAVAKNAAIKSKPKKKSEAKTTPLKLRSAAKKAAPSKSKPKPKAPAKKSTAKKPPAKAVKKAAKKR